MIRLGLRLTLGSGREALLRVLVTAAAVALGVGLLLAALAGINGLHAQSDRGAWLNSAVQPTPPTSPASGLWWEPSTDSYGSQLIDQIDVAAAGPGAPIPPGMSRLPGPGQYFASPELVSLLRSQPANELRDRYPGRLVGTIGGAGLPSPNSLIIVVGHSVGQLSKQPAAIEIGAIHRGLANCYGCQSAVGSGPVLEFILVGGAVALVLPVLILIATASRLSAVRREERFASMRLVGATPRQISTISAVEAVIAALAGVVLGFGLFFAVRPLLYHVPFTGAPLAQGDLSLHAVDILIAVVGVPIAAVVSARLALRRVQISPLGVTRRVRKRPPGIARIVPLLAGIAFLAYFDAAGKPGAIGSQLLELLVGFALLIVGLVLAGPWFTTAGSRIMAKRASRPATLIAGRHLLDDPKAAFRFVSGLVIALFVASAAIGALSSVTQVTGGGSANASLSTLADPFCTYSTTDCPTASVVASVPPSVLTSSGRRRGCKGWRWSMRLPTRRKRGDRSGSSRVTNSPRLRPSAVRTAGHRGVRRILPLEGPGAHRQRVDNDLALLEPVGDAARIPPRERGRRRDERVFGCDRTGTNGARARIPAPGHTGDRGGTRSLDGAPADHDPGHDRRDHRGQPDHRCVQPGREHRGRCR